MNPDIVAALPADIPFAALNFAGVAVFAATGALAAARRGYDIVTFAFFGAVTGIGGGTLRDILIGAPVFWVSEPEYVVVCVLAAVVVWFTGARTGRLKALLWLDAAGMAAYAVLGASKTLALGGHPIIAVVMGVLTASFGGVLRDVLAGEPSVLLRREISISAALLGAVVYVVLDQAGALPVASATAGVVSGFALRAGALRYGWSLPAYGPDRDAPKDGGTGGA